MRRPIIPSLLALLVIAGCSGSEAYYGDSVPQASPASERIAAATATPAQAADALNAPSPDPAAAPPAVDRIVIYAGHIQLVVSDIARTLDAIQAHAVAGGGYLQEMDGKSLIVRIPAKRFSDTFNWVARQGEVVGRQIKSQDVTEELRDLKLRLENAEHTRTRLLDILAKSTKTEDTLKIESELQRITETIELLKGKLVVLNSQVAFSTLKVTLNSPLPQNQLVAQIPFDWVRRLGEGVLSGSASPYAKTSRRDRREIRLEVPKSYIRYYDADETSELMSADGVVVKIHKHDNYKGGNLDFWSTLARRVLVDNRAVALDRVDTITLSNKRQAKLLSGSRDLAGQKSGYLLLVLVEEETVTAAEAWGPLAPFQRDAAAIEASLKTVDPR